LTFKHLGTKQAFSKKVSGQQVMLGYFCIHF